VNSVTTPRVSVLVPVYNAERYLSECLESVLQQSLKDIEIVCVDDASTDGSAEIIRRSKSTDQRLRYVRHERNRGEGASRNTALQEARGAFVFHLDADDLLPEHALESLWRAGHEHGSQMVKGAYSTISHDGRVITRCLGAPAEPIINARLETSEFLRRIPVAHTSYLYRRSFLRRNALRYRTDMKVGLDLVALAESLVAATRVTALQETVYLYRQTATSASRGKTTTDIALDGMNAKRLVAQLLRRAGHEDSATQVLRTWDWQIPAFWATLDWDSPNLALDDLFEHFRDLIPEGLTPWTQTSPLAHRYLLASILLCHDRDAQRALEAIRDGTDFQASPDLDQRVGTILTLDPDDAMALELRARPREAGFHSAHTLAAKGFSTLMISLEKDRERRAHAIEQLRRVGIEPTVVPAVNAHDEQFEFGRYRHLSRGKWWDWDEFKPGAFGCSLSHAACWQRISEDEEPFALICEDDLIVEPGPFEALVQCPLPDDFDIIFINQGAVQLLELAFTASERPTEPFQRLNDILLQVVARGAFTDLLQPGSYGYLVSRSGAGKLLDLMQREKVCMGVDYAMAFGSLEEADMDLLRETSLKSEYLRIYLDNCAADARQPGLRTRVPLKAYLWNGAAPVRHRFDFGSSIDHKKLLGFDVFQ
jgi:GR25 family glycosyltransferase involved in LPS biosynthesis